jgi:hypothetical protein
VLCHQNVGQNQNIYNFCKDVAKFIHFGMIVTNQNFFHDEIREHEIQGMLATI